ncbi:MAG: hypothetical protein PVI09_02480 [Anaerolineae bacterium]
MKRQIRLWLALALLATVTLGCGPDFLARGLDGTPEPVKTLRPTFTPMPSPTHTAPPSPTPVAPTATLLPAATAVVPTSTPEQPTPTNTSEPATATPEPATPTPPPATATQAPPRPTRVPPPTATPAPQAKHVIGSHGVSGLVVARDKTVFAVGEKAFFTYEAVNHTNDPVGFVLLGIKASNGQFNTSWVNPDVIQPGVPFKHDDGLTFDSPGTYQVFLAICFDRCDEPDGDWEEFHQGAATITVQ